MTVVISGPISSYNVLKINTLRNESGFVSIDIYDANSMEGGGGGCVCMQASLKSAAQMAAHKAG